MKDGKKRKDELEREIGERQRIAKLEALEATQKRTEEALQQSEARYRAVVEQSADAIYLIDVETKRVLEANLAFAQMLGYTPEEILRLSHYDFVAADREDMDQRFRNFLREGHFSHERQFRRKDGSLMDVWVIGSLISYAGREVACIISRDITERKQAEEALHLSHRFLSIANRHREMTPLLSEFVAEVKALTGCHGVGVRLADEEGNIPYQAYEGFSQRFYELESPLSIRSDQCMCINVIKGIANPELPYYTKGGSFYINGTTRFLATVSEEEKGKSRNVCNEFGYESVALVPIRLGERLLGLIHVADPQENKLPLGMVEMLEGAAMQLGTAIQRVRAEEALQESEERYRATMEQSADGIYLVDVDTERIIAANRALAQMLGYTQGEMRGMHIYDFIAADPLDIDNRFQKVLSLRGKAPFDHERKYRRKDGSLMEAWVRGTTLTFRGREVMCTFLRDITERKRAEEERKRLLAELQAKNRELESFVYTVSHDLKAPLVSLSGFSCALQKESYSQLGKEGKHYLNLRY